MHRTFFTFFSVFIYCFSSYHWSQKKKCSHKLPIVCYESMLIYKHKKKECAANLLFLCVVVVIWVNNTIKKTCICTHLPTVKWQMCSMQMFNVTDWMSHDCNLSDVRKKPPKKKEKNRKVHIMSLYFSSMLIHSICDINIFQVYIYPWIYVVSACNRLIFINFIATAFDYNEPALDEIHVVETEIQPFLSRIHICVRFFPLLTFHIGLVIGCTAVFYFISILQSFIHFFPWISIGVVVFDDAHDVEILHVIQSL